MSTKQFKILLCECMCRKLGIMAQFCISLLTFCFISFKFYFDRPPSGSLMLQLPCNRTSTGPRGCNFYGPPISPRILKCKCFGIWVLYLLFEVMYLGLFGAWGTVFGIRVVQEVATFVARPSL